MITEQDRYRGALLGLAIGDAIGTTVEFKPRGSFAEVTDMTGGGPFGLEAGQWTDDTSMALCLAESLLHAKGFDALDQMERYCNWYRNGYLSSTGRCFDIGNTTAQALQRFERERNPFAGALEADTAGNGALMRLAPIPMFYAPDVGAVLRYSAESTRTTHGAPEAIECSKLFGLQLHEALIGRTKDAILAVTYPEPLSPKVDAIARGAYVAKSIDDIRGSGYAVDALEAALWCFWHTSSFKGAVLQAANLGDDADTTAAICGQLAGAYYGVQEIPEAWLDKLAMQQEILSLADRLMTERAGATAGAAAR